MSLKKCSNGNTIGWKWGDTGHCYIGVDAKRFAIKQAIAEGHGKFIDMGQFNINRSVFMFDVFDQSSSEDMIKQIIALDQESNEPINIFINSYGGEVLSLFAILDTIANLNCQVNTICLGEADSCGAVLLSAGDLRYIGKNSRSMIHEVSALSWGKLSEMQEQLTLASTINDRLVNILAKNTNKDFTYLKELIKNDVWMNADETKNLGLVDFIMEENLFDVFKDAFTNISDLTKVYTNFTNGRSKDGIVTKLLYDVIKKGGGVGSSTSTISKTKGDVQMDKEQLLIKLKDEFQLDIAAIMADLASIKDEVTTVKAENEILKLENIKLSKELKDTQEAQKDKEFEDLFASLINEGKATQNLINTVYRDAFRAIGLEKAREAAKSLPIIIKDKQTGTSMNEYTNDDITKDFKEIVALAKAEDLSFSDASRRYYNRKRKE